MHMFKKNRFIFRLLESKNAREFFPYSSYIIIKYSYFDWFRLHQANESITREISSSVQEFIVQLL